MTNEGMGILVLFILFFLGRMLNHRALKKLNEEQKTSFIAILSKMRLKTFLPLIILAIIYMICFKMLPVYTAWLNSAYALIFIIYLIVSNALVFVQIKKNKLPSTFTGTFFIGRILPYAGFAAFFYFYFGQNIIFTAG